MSEICITGRPGVARELADTLHATGHAPASGARDASARAQVRRCAHPIHPGASVGYRQREPIARRQGVPVRAGVRFTGPVRGGDIGIVNVHCAIGHDGVTDEDVNIAPGAHRAGNGHVGAGCAVGTGALLKQGSDLATLVSAPRMTMGSGSLVVKSCDADAVDAGIPVKRIQ